MSNTTTKPKPKTVLIYSGGLDSTVLLYHLLDLGHEVHTPSFDYGQRHAHELTAAGLIARRLCKVPCHIVVLDEQLFLGSSQTSPGIDVPHGHYTDENMKITVVPNRNMVMLSLAVSYAISIGAHSVAYAAHAGDHAIYPDCRPEFTAHLQSAIYSGNEHQVSLYKPFILLSKGEIVALGSKLKVPFESTWSCYDPQPVADDDFLHCGLCGTCVERREAFTLAGVPDPTEYAEAQ